MAVKLRLQRHGRKKAPYYHIVVAPSTAPRDGRFIERLGYYNPTKVPAQIDIDVDKAVEWLDKGAQPTDTVRAILRYKGVLYKKHLMRGVKKGAFDLEAAEAKFADWQKSHENAVMDHVKSVEDKASKAKAEEAARYEAKRQERIAAEQKAVAEAEAAAEAEAVEASAEVADEVEVTEAAETEAPVAEAATEEAPAVEEAPAAEEAAEEPKTEE
ncbi:MAG: 30S ribosomal protein S16 [Chitinophagales bacterium]